MLYRWRICLQVWEVGESKDIEEMILDHIDSSQSVPSMYTFVFS